MRSWGLAALLVALLAMPGGAQMRSGMHFGGPARSGFRGSGVFFNGGLVGNRHFGFFFNGNNFFFGHRRAFFSPFFFGSQRRFVGYYPYGGYSYPIVIQTAPASSYYPPEYYNNGKLQQDIDVLTGKVDRLQQELDYRLPQKPQAPVAAHPTTMLVFKDQHTQEVQNYAIVGETLWVLDDDRAEKVPLSELDPDATTRINQERGVEFQLPK